MLHKFQCGLCNESYYGECVRHIAGRSGEHIGISPLTNKRVQRRRDSGVCHHLLNFSYSRIVLCHENKKHLLEIKESLLIIRDRPSVNRNVRFSIFLNEFLSYCLLRFVDFCDEFLLI